MKQILLVLLIALAGCTDNAPSTESTEPLNAEAPAAVNQATPLAQNITIEAQPGQITTLRIYTNQTSNATWTLQAPESDSIDVDCGRASIHNGDTVILDAAYAYSQGHNTIQVNDQDLSQENTGFVETRFSNQAGTIQETLEANQEFQIQILAPSTPGTTFQSNIILDGPFTILQETTAPADCTAGSSQLEGTQVQANLPPTYTRIEDAQWTPSIENAQHARILILTGSGLPSECSLRIEASTTHDSQVSNNQCSVEAHNEDIQSIHVDVLNASGPWIFMEAHQ